MIRFMTGAVPGGEPVSICLAHEEAAAGRLSVVVDSTSA